MAKDSTTPATKSDIQMLKRHIGATDRKIEKLRSDMEAWKEEIVGEFKLFAEEMKEEFRAASQDKFSLLEDVTTSRDRRITRLEQRAGILPA